MQADWRAGFELTSVDGKWNRFEMIQNVFFLVKYILGYLEPISWFLIIDLANPAGVFFTLGSLPMWFWKFVYLYIYVCIYIYMFIYIYVYIFIYMCIYIHMDRMDFCIYNIDIYIYIFIRGYWPAFENWTNVWGCDTSVLGTRHLGV